MDNVIYFFKKMLKLYYHCTINKIYDRNKIKTMYDNNYFDYLYNEIFIKKNVLIFTFFNNIPINLHLLPKEFYYHYTPLITFYDSDNDTVQDLNIGEPLSNFKNFYFQDSPNYAKFSETIVNPINVLINCINDDYKYIILLKNNDILIGHNIKFINNTNFNISLLYNKNKSKYEKKTQNMKINIMNLTYCCILRKFKKNDMTNVYKMTTIPKNTYLYHHRHDDKEVSPFFGIYPFNNLINPFGFFDDLKYKCYVKKIKQDLNNVLYINVDTFVFNPLVGYDDINKIKYYDTTDKYYKTIISNENGLFLCIGDDLKTRKNCNFNRIKNYKNIDTWEKNNGKRTLNEIIFKTKLFINYNYIYYIDFLKLFNVKYFLNNYGILYDENSEKYLDTELAFVEQDTYTKYLESITTFNGECNEYIKSIQID